MAKKRGKKEGRGGDRRRGRLPEERRTATITVELPVCPRCASLQVKRQRTGEMIGAERAKNMLCLECGQPFVLFIRFCLPGGESRDHGG